VRRKREKRRSAPASDSPDVPAHGELEPLAQRFRRFADEARGYGGSLYAALSAHIAQDNDLLEIAGYVRRPPVPNVFFAAVHFLLRETPEDELSTFYGSLGGNPRLPSHAYPSFRRFVLANKARLIPLLETRITQTNEVSRCSFLLPAFNFIYQSAERRPLAIIDVGCSAGLHLRWDRYHYDYGVAQVGDARAALSIRCELRGVVVPPLPAQFPVCPFKLGIDLHPVDLQDPIERRWFEALIWPEHERRRRLATAAIEELLRDPPPIVKGDAVHVLEAQLERVPADTTLVVYNVAALHQGGAVEQNEIVRVLSAFSFRQPLHWLYCENEGMLLRAIDGGRIVETKLAGIDGHGRWLEWLCES
jgi:hypothetical protein